MPWISPGVTLAEMARTRTTSKYPPAFLAMLEEAGFASPHAAAVAAGKPDMLRDLARGKTRTVRVDSLEALALVLKRPIEEVQTALGLQSAKRETRAPRVDEFDGVVPAPEALRRNVRAAPSLPVRYVVHAGAWIERDDHLQTTLHGPPVTADPRFPRDAQWLELVRGDSMDRFYPEGAWVHVVDAVAIGYTPRNEDLVAVERKRFQGGLIERSLKQIAIARGRVQLWPRSTNPKHQQPLQLNDESHEDTTVEIAALVLGGYLPARR